MTREDKQMRKHRRCEKRRKEKEDYTMIGYYMKRGLSVGQARSMSRWGYFYNDYGEQKQLCDYGRGSCNYPCNGDC